jgi:hypothetical protein
MKIRIGVNLKVAPHRCNQAASLLAVTELLNLRPRMSRESSYRATLTSIGATISSQGHQMTANEYGN